MINLINNAIKFTPRNGRIVIESEYKKGLLELCVEDNGVGIPANQINGLFNLGSEYRRPGTEKEKGSGLGLITAKEFVSLMGGTIKTDSEQGKGSRFCVRIPEDVIS